jgi:hypothetical protein
MKQEKDGRSVEWNSNVVRKKNKRGRHTTVIMKLKEKDEEHTV